MPDNVLLVSLLHVSSCHLHSRHQSVVATPNLLTRLQHILSNDPAFVMRNVFELLLRYWCTDLVQGILISKSIDALRFCPLSGFINTLGCSSKMTSTHLHPYILPNGAVIRLQCLDASSPNIDTPPDFIICAIAIAASIFSHGDQRSYILIAIPIFLITVEILTTNVAPYLTQVGECRDVMLKVGSC